MNIPQGFKVGSVHCGLKTVKGALDLGIVAADGPATAAGVFTQNKIVAAPVVLSQANLKKGRARAIVVNAGNANACTGKPGFSDAETMCQLTAEYLGCKPDDVLVASTGIIGEYLPMAKIQAGIADAAGQLRSTSAALKDVAQAIMTTDTVPKLSSRSVKIRNKTIRLVGVCKGAGMIAPNMATMLGFVMTDAVITPATLRAALASAVDETFNTITVDDHTSTNDCVLALASGAAGNASITKGGPGFKRFADGLTDVCRDLSEQIVRDGEGATRIARVEVRGACSTADARLAARAIAASPLVKCALHGADPNWGRIVSAVGYSGARIDAEKMSCRIGGQTVFRRGMAAVADKKKLANCMAEKEVHVLVDLAMGRGRYSCLMCDFSKDYITINADYHT